MNDVLYMAWRYVRFHWGKTVLLVSAISLVLFLPAGLYVVVEQGARTLTARAESTPLLIGAKGSAVDLTLSALYFRTPNLSPCEFREVRRVDQTGLAMGIPLHLRYTVREPADCRDHDRLRRLPRSGRGTRALVRSAG